MPNTEQSIEETGGVPEIELEVEVFGMVQTATDKSLTIPDMAADAKATGEAIANLAADVAALFDNLYPVGSVYITAAEELPTVIADIGTWVEIAIPLTHKDMRVGTRSYAETGESFEPGNLHSWLRTE